MFKENLNNARIKIKVGNVVKSDGFWIYKDINKINKDKDKDITKRNQYPFGREIIIRSIATKSATTTKSLRISF